jgi:hypothetical protein
MKAAFKDAPLSANFEGGDIAVVNHSVQRPFRDFQNCSSFSERKKFDIYFGVFHISCLPKHQKSSKPYATVCALITCCYSTLCAHLGSSVGRWKSAIFGSAGIKVTKLVRGWEILL